jgi:hypothetical protein
MIPAMIASLRLFLGWLVSAFRSPPITVHFSVNELPKSSLRLTDVGSEVLEHGRHTIELNEAVDNIASNHLSNVSGELRLSAPPSISDSLLAPLIGAFQASYPKVRVQVFIFSTRKSPTVLRATICKPGMFLKAMEPPM